MEGHQFDGVTPEDISLCHGLFGDAYDVLHAGNRDTFLRHYLGLLRMFHGGHRMNADVVNRTLIPFILGMGIFM